MHDAIDGVLGRPWDAKSFNGRINRLNQSINKEQEQELFRVKTNTQVKQVTSRQNLSAGLCDKEIFETIKIQ